MGFGFPTIADRDAFGPTYRADEPVRFPTKELSAGAVNISAHQLAGMARTLPSVVITVQITDFGVPTLVNNTQQATFDPNGLLTAITPAKATDAVTITFAARYRDETETLIRWRPLVAIAKPIFVTGSAAANPWECATSITAQTVSVETRNTNTGSSALTDAAFQLMVWG